MAFTFPRLSWRLWSGKERKPSVRSGSSPMSSSESTIRELDAVNLRAVNGPRFPSTSRKVKKKLHIRGERKAIDKEYDMVLVPSDGGCMSGSESDDSDWSIGWLEPHGPEFQDGDAAEDNSFAVLVPCYGKPIGQYVAERTENRLLGIFSSSFDNGYSAESKKHIEKWLSSLQEA